MQNSPVPPPSNNFFLSSLCFFWNFCLLLVQLRLFLQLLAPLYHPLVPLPHELYEVPDHLIPLLPGLVSHLLVLHVLPVLALPDVVLVQPGE